MEEVLLGEGSDGCAQFCRDWTAGSLSKGPCFASLLDFQPPDEDLAHSRCSTKDNCGITHKSSKMKTENLSVDGARQRSWVASPTTAVSVVWSGRRSRGGFRSTLLPVCERQGCVFQPFPDAPWKHGIACPHQDQCHHARKLGAAGGPYPL